jgi:hypothetical protein
VNQTEPTARPWTVEATYSGSRTVAQLRSTDRIVCVNATGEARPNGYDATDANAALIVRAVNSHEALTAALAAVADWAQDSGPLAGKTPGDVAEYCREAAEGQS